MECLAKKYSSLNKLVIFADTYGLALQLAEDGNGVTLTSKFLAATALSTGALEQISDEVRMPTSDDYPDPWRL